MPRYLIELQLPSDDKTELARLRRVIRAAIKRTDDGRPASRVDCIGLASNGHRTYCVVRCMRAASVTRLTQTAMLPARILRIIEMSTKRA